MLTRSFVLPRPRCLHRLGLLRVPSNNSLPWLLPFPHFPRQSKIEIIQLQLAASKIFFHLILL